MTTITTPPTLTPTPVDVPDKYGSNPPEFDVSIHNWFAWWATRTPEEQAMAAWMQTTALAMQAMQFNRRGNWVTNSEYSKDSRDWVQYGGSGYVCVVSHISETFTTDLAAGKWVSVDVLQYITDMASQAGPDSIGYSGARNYAVQTLGAALKDISVNVKVFPWLAKGDGTTDDKDAINAAMLAASNIAAANNGMRVKVLIPPGVYACAGELTAKSNTVIENQGHLKFTGGNAVGQFFSIRAVSNVEVFGGVWDSNGQGNDNTIAVSFVNSDQSVAGPKCQNIFIHDLLIKNSAHGGSEIVDINDPADVGRGGGKGFTVQFGAENVLINNVVLDNCDLGFSVEGKESDTGYVNGIQISNVTVKNAKYMGMYLKSVINTVGLYGQTTGLLLNNIDLIDCGVGQTTETVPRDIATLFGAITCQGMVDAVGTNIRVRSTTGKQTIMRGATRSCRFDIRAVIAGELVDVVNTAPYGGFNPTNTETRHLNFKCDLFLLGATFSGYFANNNATYPANFSLFDFTGIHLNGGTAAAFSTAKYSTNFPSSSEFRFKDLHSGKSITCNDGAAQTGALSGFQTFINGLGIDDDASFTRLAPTRGILSLLDSAGASQLWVENGLVNIRNRLVFNNSALMLEWGTGAPEGVLTAVAGSIYLRTDGGTGITFYVKETGSGNTGWVAK